METQKFHRPMMAVHFRSLVLGLLFLTIFPNGPALAAAPGDLDVSFDTDGMVTTDFAVTHDQGYAIALQRDGKIVVGGISANDFALARYNVDGSLDTTFGTGGKVTTDFFGSIDEIRGIVIQSDGKIVAAGYTHVSGSNYDFALARYNSNGTLDTTFSGDGKVTTDFASSSEDLAYGVAIQSNGRIVVVGYTYTTIRQYAVARYNSNGNLDTSFDGDGKVINDFGYANSQTWYALAIQSDGKIVAAGSGNSDFTLARYNSNGSLDSAFGSGGKVTTDFGNGASDYVQSIAIQYDGKIVVAGVTLLTTGGTNFALARYNTNGTLDAAFDADGKVTTDFGGPYDEAYAVLLQGDGKIVAAGRTSGGVDIVFALARYNSNGTLDTTFGSGGLVTTMFAGGSSEVARGLAIQWDGKLVAAGMMHTGMGGNYNFALARYWLVSCP